MVDHGRDKAPVGQCRVLQRAFTGGQLATLKSTEPHNSAGEENEQRQPTVAPKVIDRVVANAVRGQEHHVAFEELGLRGPPILDAERSEEKQRDIPGGGPDRHRLPVEYDNGAALTAGVEDHVVEV